MHQADNRRLLHLLATPAAEAFPANDVWHANYVQWADDLGAVVDAELTASLGAQRFGEVMNGARLDCGNAASLDKNTYLIQYKMTRALDAGATCPSLDRLCEWVLA